MLTRQFTILIYFIIISCPFFTAHSQWEACSNGLVGLEVNCLTTVGNNIFAGTYGGVFLSTDNGNNWSEKNEGLDFYGVLSLASNGQSRLFAGSFGGGIYLSNNNGNSWTKKNNGITDADILTIAISSSFSYAGTFQGHIFQTNNNGDNWVEKSNGLDGIRVQSMIIYDNSIFACLLGQGVFLSTDNGNNWTKRNDGLKSRFVTTLAVSGSNIFAGEDGDGVYLTTNNGKNWEQKSHNMNKKSVQALIISENKIFAGTRDGGVFISTDNGDNWYQNIDGLTNTYVISLAIRGNYIFAGTQGGGVFRAKLSDFVTYIKPEISNINDIIMDEDSTIAFDFTVNSNNPDILDFIKLSDNSELIPPDSIKITGKGKNRILSITPRKRTSGFCNIIIKVTNGTDTASASFNVTVLLSTSTDDYNNGLYQSISISPNPVNDELTITRVNEKSGTLVITNRLGQTVYKSALEFDEKVISMPFSDSPAGDYYIRIITQDGLVERQRFIKN